MTDLHEIRARARAHQEELDQHDTRKWLTVAMLARRFSVSESTVRAIPVDELPYKEFGKGLKLRRRRYRLTDVEAFEAVDVRHTRPQK